VSEPTVPPDESDEGYAEPAGEDDALRRLLDQRPPHHDRD
jgi:hypothetical protein